MESPSLIDYAEISEQSWNRLHQAADDRSHPMRLMTLTTVDKRGQPDARVLVLRGASRAERSLWFHTDSRSKKISQLLHQPRVCVIGYDARDDVQLRIFGSATLHQDDELAGRHWEQTDLAVRHSYIQSHHPGEPIPPHDPLLQQHHELIQSENADLGRDNFLVIEIVVDSIDWIQVLDSRQRRAALHATSDWIAEPLVP